MSIIHIRATAAGAVAQIISPSAHSTGANWRLKQVLVHCQATFTAVSTMTVQLRSHEATAYNAIFYTTTVATADTVLQDIVYVPDNPISLVGKDAISLTFAGVSAALPWAYDIAVEM